jgi:sulfur-oxidizing protein SoxA
MKTSVKILACLFLFNSLYVFAEKTAAEDRQMFRDFFSNRFPSIELSEYINGSYIFNEKAMEQWLEIEDFPPYEFDIDTGKELFETPFANGKLYASCFENGGIGIKHKFPQWSKSQNTVITLEYAINQCREENAEKPLAYGLGEIAQISSYMAYTSRGKIIDVKEPTANSMDAYLKGKKYYFSKRGQLNMACANCHMGTANLRLRYEIPGPVLGQITNWPVYRSKWEKIGTIHHRIRECNSQVRANPLEYQSEIYRNLEYFLTYISNGLPINGPGTRK